MFSRSLLICNPKSIDMDSFGIQHNFDFICLLKTNVEILCSNQKLFMILEFLCAHTLRDNMVRVDDNLFIDYFEIILRWYTICRLHVKVRIICSLVLCFKIHVHVLILGIKSIPADFIVRIIFNVDAFCSNLILYLNLKCRLDVWRNMSYLSYHPNVDKLYKLYWRNQI